MYFLKHMKKKYMARYVLKSPASPKISSRRTRRGALGRGKGTDLLPPPTLLAARPPRLYPRTYL